MKIKVAAIQMNCELANVDANLAKAEALLKEAVEKGAKWVIFPELFNTAYWIPKQDVELAEDIPDRSWFPDAFWQPHQTRASSPTLPSP